MANNKDNSAPKIVTISFKSTVPRLTTDGTRKPYRAFIVDVTLDDGSLYTLSHLRYSDFSDLDGIFKELFPLAHQVLPPFPRKTLGRPTEEQWKERVRALDLYFTGVLAMPALAQNSTFVKLFSRVEEQPDIGMRAAVYNEFGSPDKVVRVVNNLPKPAMPLKPTDVFIEVYASSVNLTDIRMMEGASDVLEFLGVVNFPFTPGVDVCGIVRGIGAEVTSFQVGDAVIADTGIVSGGGMAEFCTAPQDHCARKPKNMSFVEAAAFPRAGLIAYQTLVHDLKIDVEGNSKKLLILGAHTGSGSIGVQIGKYFGCNVTCTVPSGCEDWARRLGADSVIVHTGWWEALPEKSFDAVFDTMGEDEGFERSQRVLSDKGGFATELPEYLRKNAGELSAWVKQGVVTAGRKIRSVAGKSYHNAWAVVNEDLEKLRTLIEGGDFKTVANQYFALKEAQTAFDLVKNDCCGKVVIVLKEELLAGKGESSDIEREFSSRQASKPNLPQVIAKNDNSNNDRAPTAAAVAAPPARTSSPPPASSGASDDNNNEPPVAKTRNFAADDFEDEPAGQANPFN